ncbi:hypothetical protein LS482_00050 [Sinomicrobium kalidii]|uniref:hypothetical protein n=1 Tax=Sinomicrobium kalidii TaxID=2900738 RepID=UPI001E2F0902|nr:hypothetical protein [Sinomicrobium kalidii]UGU16275.1 hypothetical protein LS482_00050 [Sinomicrobium kalidii]
MKGIGLISIYAICIGCFLCCKESPGNTQEKSLSKKHISISTISMRLFQESIVYKKQQLQGPGSLKNCFQKISSDSASDNYFVEYVRKFPSTFQTFQEYFGFDDVTGKAMPLYKEANEYIDKFFQASEICCQKEVFEKIIKISQTGKWDADAVNYLRHKIKGVRQ